MLSLEGEKGGSLALSLARDRYGSGTHAMGNRYEKVDEYPLVPCATPAPRTCPRARKSCHDETTDPRISAGGISERSGEKGKASERTLVGLMEDVNARTYRV